MNTGRAWPMRAVSVSCLMLAAALLTSCGTAGTTIVNRQRLDKDVVGKLDYKRIVATSSVWQFTQKDLDQLREAVLARVPQPADGGVPVELQLAVNQYTSGGSRMLVKVRVLDAAGKSYAEFDVYRTANTLMGVIDQRTSSINAIADAVARSLAAISAAPPAVLDARDYGS